MTLKLRVVTPRGVEFEEEVKSLILPAAEGEVLRLESVGLDLAVAQVYQDVLPEEAPAVPPPPAPG